MGKVIGILSVLVFSAGVNAKEVVVEVPDEGVRYKQIYANYDGSVTLEGPQVHFNNAFRYVGSLAKMNNISEIFEAAHNTCTLFALGRRVSHTHTTVALPRGARVVTLDTEGKISGVLSSQGDAVSYITSVTCRAAD